MHATLTIAWRDLRRGIRDRSAILLTVVAPFALAAVFSLVLGGLGEDGFNARWGYVDLDGGEIAAALESGPLAALEADGAVSLARYETAEAARAAVEAGDVSAVIVVPGGFSSAVTSAAGASVELITDADVVLSGQVARAVLAGFAHEVEAVGLSVATALVLARQPPDAQGMAALREQALAMADPITLVDRAADDRRADYATYYGAAMAILFVFFAAQIGVSSIHAERRDRTLARMLASPIRWWAILAGKVTVSFVLATVSLAVIVVGTALLLGARWGDPLAVAALLLAAALAATGISILVVAFTRNEEQAGSAIAIVSLTMAIIGGSFFPTGQGPELLGQLSRLTPHAWFLEGIGDVAGGGDVTAAWLPVAVLAATGLVTGALGLLRGRRLVLS